MSVNSESVFVYNVTVLSAQTAASDPVVVPFPATLVDVRAVSVANLGAARDLTVKQNGANLTTTGLGKVTIPISTSVSNVLTSTAGVNDPTLASNWGKYDNAGQNNNVSIGTNFGLYAGQTSQGTGATGIGGLTNQPANTVPVATAAAGDLFTVTPSAAPGSDCVVALTFEKR